MRINDESICIMCMFFEHECDLENGCKEFCKCSNFSVIENFYDDEKIILECEEYKE